MRLGVAALVLLAYRATFIGNYALNVHALRRAHIVRGPGFGRNVIERGLRQCIEAGYLLRMQPPSRNGETYRRALECLAWPDCKWKDREAWRFVRRCWFDGTLSVKEMAAYLYLRAMRGATAKDLRIRFWWSPPTARNVLKARVKLNLAKAKGRRYLPLSASAVWPSKTEKSRGTESANFRGTETKKHWGTHLPYGVKENVGAQALAALASGAAPLARATDGGQTATPATPSVALFAARSNCCVVELAPPEPVAPGTLARVAAVATDKVLAAAIKTATGGRVADTVLSPLGLNALRQHAGSLVTPERDPAAALNAVLRAVHARLDGGGKLFASALNREGFAA